MSEDPTKDMAQKYDTKPTIETVLERMEAMRADIIQAMQSEIKVVRGDMQALREDMQTLREDMQVRFDRLEGVVSATRSEFVTFRADFIEWKRALRENIPALKA